MTQMFYSAERERHKEWEQNRQRSERRSRLSPEQVAQEDNRHCPHCNDLLIPYAYDYHLNGREVRQWLYKEFHGCPSEAEAIAARADYEAREKRVQAQAELEAMRKRAGLVGWLGQATFDNFNLRQDWSESAEVKSRVMAYCLGLIDDTLPRSKNWLILYGNYGNGKSHLAAAIIQQVHLLKQPSYFRVWPAYLDRIKASWEREKRTVAADDDEFIGETEDDIARELRSGKVVVMDDLDKMIATEWAKSTLYKALNHRYNAELPTILTFNFGPDEADPKAPGRLALEAYLGRAVLDRVIGATYDVIEFTGPSFRSGVSFGAK